MHKVNGVNILVADDELPILKGLKALLEEEGYRVSTANTGSKAFELLRQNHFDLLLVDLTIPGMNGIEILEGMKQEQITTEVIIITGKGTISTAVEAMRAGAYDYLTKPVTPDRLRSIIPKVIEHHQLLRSYRELEDQLKMLTHYEDLIGQSPQMQHVYKMIDAVADSTANVIITGESGTGKELASRAIHRRGSRASGPFIAVNCSALPRDILENELFGHEKGAFTGALNEKPGCFELAHNGTLFLDEIGEMAIETQAKILRALEERRYRRLGGKNEIEVDVRLISATNRDLKQVLKEGRLREDLYYRLCVVEIEMPPLRERMSDIPLLMEEFLNLFNRANHKNIKGFTADCQDVLLKYSWPGNVRELKNIVERAVVLCQSEKINIGHLPVHLQNLSPENTTSVMVSIGTPLNQAEQKIIYGTLESVNFNKTKASKILGISLKTLYNKLKL